MDAGDYSVKLQEEQLQRSLADVRRNLHQLPHVGRCHNCSEEVEPWELFCDTDCQQDHDDRERKRAHRMGF